MLSVHITISDKNWILEKLASCIVHLVDYVTFDTVPDPSADIQYYMTYSTRRLSPRMSPIELAFFAHYEEFHEEAQKWFWHVAKDVDHCVCMSKRYEALLREHGVTEVTTISPGVDLEEFRPKVKIGVVGRTYATGRKGEDLVKQVMDIPEIEWHFTGTGWPGLPLHVPPGKMADFYNSMDYILVPAHYEGGPMCVLEGLACGKPIIAPPVGWVPNFPHIEFETGNAEGLRKVLLGVVDQRKELRRSVEHVTWEHWAQEHDKLFRELFQASGGAERFASRRVSCIPGKVALCASANEIIAKGGPSVRVPKTALALRHLGVDAVQQNSLRLEPNEYALVHTFNVSPPEDAFRVITRANLAQVPVVISSIILDYSERAQYEKEVVPLFRRTPEMVEMGFAQLRRKRTEEIAAGKELREPGLGYFAQLRRILAAADHVICLSEHEKRLIDRIGVVPKAISLVRNPVDAELYSTGNPELFAKEFGVRNYVLCVGRKEMRKSQLTLLHALRDTKLPIVLIGEPFAGHKEYLELLNEYVKRFNEDENQPSVHMIDRLPPHSDLLLSAYAGARVFVLPSWSEGAPLAALEAAASGCTMVLSNRSSEQEYFGDFARYCDPANPSSIRTAVLEAYASPHTPERRREQQEFVRSNFSWERYAEDTLRVYEETLKLGSRFDIAAVKTSGPIYVDLTTSGERSMTPTGVPRVESRYAIELKRLMPERVQLVKWYGPAGVFLPITLEQAVNGSYTGQAPMYPQLVGKARKALEKDYAPYAFLDFEPNSLMLVMGGTWNADTKYLHDLTVTKRTKRLRLITMIYDVIPVHYPHFATKNYGDAFVVNLKKIIYESDRLLAISEYTKQEILAYCGANHTIPPDIDIIRLGDEIETEGELDFDALAEVIEWIRQRPYILTVSTITPRKNQEMLYQIWLRLLEEYGSGVPVLIIVGKAGYNSESFLNTLSRDFRIKDHILLLQNVSDSLLHWLYQNSLFTVYPTLFEGWGLPVAESLVYGKVCIASDTSSVPEIAPELTELLDPNDFMAWYSAIVRYMFDDNLREKREEQIRATYKSTSWATGAAEIARTLNSPIISRALIPPYEIGEPVAFALDLAEQVVLRGTNYQAGGWYQTEKTGTWTAGKTAVLTMMPSTVVQHSLVLTALLNASVPGDQHPRITEVHANGQQIAVWTPRNSTCCRALISSKLFPDTGDQSLVVEFRIAEPVCPSEIGCGTDERKLGLRFRQLCIHRIQTYKVSLGAILDLTDVQIKASELERCGWLPPSPSGLFSSGESAYLAFQLEDELEQDVFLQLNFGSAVSKDLGSNSSVELLLNNIHVGRFTIADLDSQTVRIMAPLDSFTKYREQILEFRLENPPRIASNTTESGSYDTGHRALALRQVAFYSQDELHDFPRTNLGVPLLLSTAGTGHQALLGGWCFPQEQGVWTEGENAWLGLMPASAPSNGATLRLKLTAKALVSHLNPQLSVDLFVNGHAAAQWSFTSGEFVEQSAEFPASLLTKQGGAIFRLRMHDPKSPEELGLGLDTRRLGVLVRSLLLEEVTSQ